MMLDSSFCCALDTHTGAYFHLSPRFLVVVGWYGYPYSWLWRCLIDFDILFIIHRISILGHILLSLSRFCLHSGMRMDD